jgi:dipicolinate synthase subunit A
MGYYPRQAIDAYRVIFNTVPSPVITEDESAQCRSDCLKIDLASEVGIAGDDVLWARGLPGKDAPESSGKLIAKTILRLCCGKE